MKTKYLRLRSPSGEPNNIIEYMTKEPYYGKMIDPIGHTFPISDASAASVLVGDDIYIMENIYGSRYSGNCFKYNILTGTVSTVAAMPIGLSLSFVFLNNNRIYVYSGKDQTNTVVATCYYLDLSDMIWKQMLTSLKRLVYPYLTLTPRCVVNIGTKAYIFGGYSSYNGIIPYIIDTVKNTCSKSAVVLPRSDKVPSTHVIGTDIFICTYSYFYDILWKYDTITDTVSAESLPTGMIDDIRASAPNGPNYASNFARQSRMIGVGSEIFIASKYAGFGIYKIDLSYKDPEIGYNYIKIVDTVVTGVDHFMGVDENNIYIYPSNTSVLPNYENKFAIYALNKNDNIYTLKPVYYKDNDMFVNPGAPYVLHNDVFYLLFGYTPELNYRNVFKVVDAPRDVSFVTEKKKNTNLKIA